MYRPGLLLPPSSPGPRLGLLWSLCLALAAPIAAHAGEPARIVPAKGLVGYVEYDGLAAHAKGWEATAAFAAFERTSAGAMTVEVARQVIDRLLSVLPPEARPTGAELLSLQGEVFRRGIASGLYDPENGRLSAVVVFKDLGRKDLRERLDEVAAKVGRTCAGGLVEESRHRDRVVHTLKERGEAEPGKGVLVTSEAFAWWFEGDDLIVVAGQATPTLGLPDGFVAPRLPLRVDAVLDAIAGKVASAATHPGRAAALAQGQDIRGFEPAGLLFLEAGPALKLLAKLAEDLAESNRPYRGLVLPEAQPIKDDLKFCPPGPEFFSASTKAAGRKQAADRKDTSPPAEVAADDGDEPVPAIVVPPEPPAPPPAADPKVARAGMKPGPIAGPSGELSRLFALLGLDGVTRVVGRWGFDGKGLLTDIRVEAPAPRRGVVALLDQPGFPRDRLPAMFPNSTAYLVGSLDLARAYDQALALAIKGLGAGVKVEGFDRAMVTMLEQGVNSVTGVRLRDDVLRRLGPTWSLSAVPPGEAGKSWFNMPVVVVGVDGAEQLVAALDTMAKHANAYFQTLGQDNPGADAKPAANRPLVALERLPAPERGFRLTSPSKLWPWLGEGLEPTILVGDSFFVMADTPRRARVAFEAAEKPRPAAIPAGEVARAIDNLPPLLTSLSVGDPRDSSLPTTLAILPKLVQYIANSSRAFKNTGDPAPAGPKALAILGLPGHDGFLLRVDPEKVPSAAAFRAELFPSVLATAVDDRGLRVIAREAIPLGCVDARYSYANSSKEGENHRITIRPFLFPGIPLGIGIDLTSRKIDVRCGVVATSAARARSKD